MLKFQDISFGYRKGQEVLSSLELEIKPGSINGLLGRNGAGKTTLLKIIAGLLYPQKGHCTVLGFNPAHRPQGLLQDIYFMSEDFFLPNLKIKDYESMYSPFYPKFNKNNFYDHLKEFSVSPDERLSAISYGQKKKFLLAFGLATQCSLFIMDEPTNGLDIPSKSQFRKLLASQISEDKTFIISTHQVKDLENLIDRIIILEDRKIIFNQSKDETSTTDIEHLFNEVIANKEVQNV